jgi:N-ethylmaleimide reductase
MFTIRVLKLRLRGAFLCAANRIFFQWLVDSALERRRDPKRETVRGILSTGRCVVEWRLIPSLIPTAMKNAKILFTPVLVGTMELAHRVVTQALPQQRAGLSDQESFQKMVEYYSQRAATGGLIVTEAAAVAPLGKPLLDAPGIFHDQQIAGWKRIVEAAHMKGSRIVLQLCHAGRFAHVVPTSGQRPVAPSEEPSQKEWPTTTPARAVNIEELPDLVAKFRAAAERARIAGFDGVEIHAANGYLLDQFLHEGSNNRTDAYGGSVQNRARLLLEVTEAVVSALGGAHVGILISPSSRLNEMADGNALATFRPLAEALNRFRLAYLHVIEPCLDHAVAGKERLKLASTTLRHVFTGKIIAAGSFESETAEAIVLNGDADLVAFDYGVKKITRSVNA